MKAFIVTVFMLIVVNMSPLAAQNYALDFDGTDDYVDCGTSIQPTNITVEAYISADILPANYWEATIVSNSSWTDDIERGFDLRCGDGQVDFNIGDGTSWYNLLSPSNALSADQWTHVAGTYDGSVQRLYINGVEVASSSNSFTPAYDATQPLFIGEHPFGNIDRPFDGKIDEVRIWNVARSQTEILANMCKELNGDETGLVAYYKMTDGSGTTLTDNSTNSNNGTLTNMDNADWVTSGAPIGDESTYDYSSPTSVNLASDDGDDVTVDNLTGTPDGVQIYRVDSAPNVTTPPGNLVQLSTEHYFGVFIAGGTSPTYTFTYNYQGHPGISDESTLDLASRANNAATSWTETDATLDQNANTLTLTNQSGTEYILGSESGDNSLPVELTSFTASAGDAEVTLRWITESEINNDAFLLERSTDGETFELLAEIEGQGTKSEQTQYEYTDRSVYNGQTYHYRLADRDYNGVLTQHKTVTATPNVDGVQKVSEAVIKEYALFPAYPNPFNPQTSIRFNVPNVDPSVNVVTLAVYNMLGQKIATLFDGPIAGGSFEMKWNGKNDFGVQQPSGVYLVQFQSDQFVQTQKITLLR